MFADGQSVEVYRMDYMGDLQSQCCETKAFGSSSRSKDLNVHHTLGTSYKYVLGTLPA